MTFYPNPVIYIDDFARAHFPQPVSDWTPVVAAALASFDSGADRGSYAGGGTLVFGGWSSQLGVATDGHYDFLTPMIPNTDQDFGIELNKSMRLVGTGTGNGAPRTRLVFAKGLGGIRTNAPGYPHNSDGSPSDRKGGPWCEIANLELVGNDTSPTTAHGVDSIASIKIDDCWIHDFGGLGVYLYGQPDGTGNDFSSVSYSNVSNNAGGGIWINGHDANGVAIIQCMIHKHSRPDTYGFWDQSLTGAVVLGSQFEANWCDIRADQASATTTFLGCYYESGERLMLGGNCVVLGNTLANALVDPAKNTNQLFGTAPQPTAIAGGGRHSVVQVTTDTGRVVLGNAIGLGSFLTLADRRENDGAWPIRLQSDATGGLIFDRAGTGVALLTFINSRCMKANGFAVDAYAVPDVARSNGGVGLRHHFLGAGGDMIFVGTASAKPISTAYPVGSIMHNSKAANVGDPTFWKLVNRAGSLQWVGAGAITE